MKTLNTLTALKEIHDYRKRVAESRVQQGRRDLQDLEVELAACKQAASAADRDHDDASIALLRAARSAAQFRTLPVNLAQERVKYRQLRSVLDARKTEQGDGIAATEQMIVKYLARLRVSAMSCEKVAVLWADECRIVRAAEETREEDLALETQSVLRDQSHV